jgi:hypothetical protein
MRISAFKGTFQMLLMPLLEVFCTFEYSTFQWLTGIQYKLHCHEVIKKAMRGTCTLISLPRCSVGGLPALFGLYGNRYRWEDTETTSSITRSISITELTKCKKNQDNAESAYKLKKLKGQRDQYSAARSLSDTSSSEPTSKSSSSRGVSPCAS